MDLFGNLFGGARRKRVGRPAGRKPAMKRAVSSHCSVAKSSKSCLYTPGCAWRKAPGRSSKICVMAKGASKGMAKTGPHTVNNKFQAAESFEGARDGYYFGVGNKGLGYYRNAVGEVMTGAGRRRKAAKKPATRRAAYGAYTYRPAQLVRRPRGRPSKALLEQRQLVDELYRPRRGRPSKARSQKLLAYHSSLAKQQM